jgi:BMFP domain-containing protein YqiC
MLAPKDFLDALSGQASRLFSGDTALARNEIESQFKALLQSGFSKLDLVSREEFDSQMVVLARTRARLESLEAKVAELEARLLPPTEYGPEAVRACGPGGLPRIADDLKPLTCPVSQALATLVCAQNLPHADNLTAFS